MRFLICKTSDDDYSNSKVLNFNTIEELITFQKKVKEPLIIEKNYQHNEKALVKSGGVGPKKAKAIAECEYSIEIYNDYRE